MKRLAVVLSVAVAGLGATSCAVGVRQAATDVGKTGATLNGKVLSTTGGSGGWYFEYGTTPARAERTPDRSIDFDGTFSHAVAEPVDGLEPGTIYHFAACAADEENPGDAFCSPDQTFRTRYDPQLRLEPYCETGGNGIMAFLTAMPPNTPVLGTVEQGGTANGPAPFTTDANGEVTAGPITTAAPGTWTVTVDWAEGTIVESLFVDCHPPSG
jgi:hypothetical protein